MTTSQKYKVFLDTSCLLAGLNSPLGGSGFIITLFKLKKIDLTIFSHVLKEANEVIQEKFPLLHSRLDVFLLNEPKLVKKIPEKELLSAYKIVRSEDTPILAAALKTRSNYLVTLDKKFRKAVDLNLLPRHLTLVSPQEFLQTYRKNELID